MKRELKNFGQEIELKRLRMDWSVEKLSKESKVSQEFIWGLENGSMSKYGLKALFSICRALVLDPEDYMSKADLTKKLKLHNEVEQLVKWYSGEVE